MKARSCLLRTRWLLIVVLSLLIMLGPMALMAKPAHAQSPYDDALAALQQLRQQLAEMLAIYNSMKPEDRAGMDAAMAASVQQALQQMYGSMSATDRAKLDEEIRRMTGYTQTQLLQMSSTIPGMVRAFDILISGIQNLSGSVNTPPTTIPPTTTTKPPTTTTKPPTTESPSGIISFERPSQGGVVDLSSESFNLKLRQLYGASGGEEAKAIYDGKLNARKQKVDAAIAAATERLEKAKRQLEMYEKIIKEKDQQKIISALKNDLDEAKKGSDEAMKELGILLAKDLAGRLSPNIEGAIQLWDYGAGINDILTLVGKTERTREDWENAGAGLVEVVKTLSDVAGFKFVGPMGDLFEITAGSIYLYLSDKRVDALENSIAQASISSEENLRRLEQQILMETIELEQLNREKNQLTKGYLN